jgi:hypothetical protein
VDFCITFWLVRAVLHRIQSFYSVVTPHRLLKLWNKNKRWIMRAAYWQSADHYKTMFCMLKWLKHLWTLSLPCTLFLQRAMFTFLPLDDGSFAAPSGCNKGKFAMTMARPQTTVRQVELRCWPPVSRQLRKSLLFLILIVQLTNNEKVKCMEVQNLQKEIQWGSHLTLSFSYPTLESEC